MSLGSTGISQQAMDEKFMAQSPTLEGGREGQSGMLGMLASGYDKMQGFSQFLGDTPEERVTNAKAFAAMVKDVGSLGKTMSDSTLMQRMLKDSTRGITSIGGGEGPSGGIAAIPKTFDPTMAQGIMSRLGFK